MITIILSNHPKHKSATFWEIWKDNDLFRIGRVFEIHASEVFKAVVLETKSITRAEITEAVARDLREDHKKLHKHLEETYGIMYNDYMLVKFKRILQ